MGGLDAYDDCVPMMDLQAVYQTLAFILDMQIENEDVEKEHREIEYDKEELNEPD
jgi:hypothetical protein